MGRPTDNPRNIKLTLQVSKTEADIIQECAELLDTSRIDVIIRGVKKIYEEIKKE